jgi:hypothetical protein
MVKIYPKCATGNGQDDHRFYIFLDTLIPYEPWKASDLADFTKVGQKAGALLLIYGANKSL